MYATRSSLHIRCVYTREEAYNGTKGDQKETLSRRVRIRPLWAPAWQPLGRWQSCLTISHPNTPARLASECRGKKTALEAAKRRHVGHHLSGLNFIGGRVDPAILIAIFPVNFVVHPLIYRSANRFECVIE